MRRKVKGMKGFVQIQNCQAANEYMDKVSQESQFTSQHKGVTIVPHEKSIGTTALNTL